MGMSVDYVGIIFAIIVSIGGVVGYIKADSISSLICGVIFGIALGYGAYRLSKDSSDIYFSLAITIILAGIMTVRYYSSQKFMPAGLLVLLSLIVILKLLYQGFAVLSTSSNDDASNETNEPNTTTPSTVIMP